MGEYEKGRRWWNQGLTAWTNGSAKTSLRPRFSLLDRPVLVSTLVRQFSLSLFSRSSLFYFVSILFFSFFSSVFILFYSLLCIIVLLVSSSVDIRRIARALWLAVKRDATKPKLVSWRILLATDWLVTNYTRFIEDNNQEQDVQSTGIVELIPRYVQDIVAPVDRHPAICISTSLYPARLIRSIPWLRIDMQSLTTRHPQILFGGRAIRLHCLAFWSCRWIPLMFVYRVLWGVRFVQRLLQGCT